ncbi:MAG: hypothetical protein L0271_10880 [Gemmatimonadetes bacterium]|nr:hypothetical protein [Gemmatimonadota bacterium]
MSIIAVKEKYEERLMALPNVTIVGIGEKDGEEVIKVYVTRKLPTSALHPHELVPRRLDGYRTDVEESGTITVQTE